MEKPKILLIHGWNHANYTSRGCTNAWGNRSVFVDSLAQHFEVILFNLPGFCGEKDPPSPWVLDDFVSFVERKIRQEKPEYILGYSFGGAIALRYKKITKNTGVNVILVSPAIIRKYENHPMSFTQQIFKMLLPKRIITILRDIYLVDIVKNPYYANANEVMRNTYRNIVSIDLTEDLRLLPEPVSLIYGEYDTATPPALIRNVLKSASHNLYIIKDGGHDIASSHTNELAAIILKITKQQ